ncbi:MAG: D-alanyl-D-alanine carboxypeptidase [Xanthobacteraceae bacterium]|nr:D-alanyl-D-alanine carboxypeptidase [Xanthobacteraceae bacterium]QYK46396.1 MAG: D-alanyl-D-alanine carboxypeptidase [Xanthobacteraceae bacterium]
MFSSLRFAFWLFLSAAFAALPARAQTPVTVTSPHAVLLDLTTRTVLYERRANETVQPGNLAKLMTAALVFQDLKANKTTLDTTFQVSLHAWRTGGAPSTGSKMFAALRSNIRIEDLVTGLVVLNGNDAAIVLAEGTSGSEAEFVKRMNARAKELGLTSAVFRNPTGREDDTQKISPRDLAFLSAHIIREYPQYYKYFAIQEFTWSKIKQGNRNPLLPLSLGADGMMIGQVKDGGYSLVGSAEQNGERLVVVVAGSRSERERIDDARRLLDWGFKSFEPKRIFSGNRVVANVRVFGGEKGSVAVVSRTDVNLRSQRGATERLNVRVVYEGPLQAPIRRGAEVAKVRVFRAQQLVLEAPLYAAEDVGVGSTWSRAWDGAYELTAGLVRGAFGKLFSRRS